MFYLFVYTKFIYLKQEQNYQMTRYVITLGYYKIDKQVLASQLRRIT